MNSNPLDLRDYLAILWARKLSIVAIAVTAGVAAFFYAHQQTPMYTSSAEVELKPAWVDPRQPQITSELTAMNTAVRVANSSAVAAIANKRLADAGLDPADVSIDAPFQTQTIIFSATSPVPRTAKATAQSYADAYLEYRRRSVLQDLTTASRGLDQELKAAAKEIGQVAADLARAKDRQRIEFLSSRYSSLLARQNQLIDQLSQLPSPEDISVGSVLRSASTASRSGSSATKAGVLGIIVGLGLGVSVAFLRERLDQGVRARGDLELSSGAQVLAFIPRMASSNGVPVTLAQPTSREAEAYQALRLRLLHSAAQTGFKSLVVTSSVAEEGKTTTVANLGVALAQAGKQVVLVSADLRRPGLQAFFPNGGKTGFTEVLLGKRKLMEVMLTTGVGNLWVLHPGPPVARPTPVELLGSEAMRDMLGQLRSVADFVLLDTPPVLAAPDAAALAPMVDGVLFVSDLRRVEKPALEQARLELRLVGAPIIGVVVNKHDPKRFRSYSSGYYYPEYGTEQEVGHISGILPAPRASSEKERTER